MKVYKIAAVQGDGIGHEIVPAGLSVLEEAAKIHRFENSPNTTWRRHHNLRGPEEFGSDRTRRNISDSAAAKRSGWRRRSGEGDRIRTKARLNG